MNSLIAALLPVYLSQINDGLRTRENIPTYMLALPEIQAALDAQEGATT